MLQVKLIFGTGEAQKAGVPLPVPNTASNSHQPAVPPPPATQIGDVLDFSLGELLVAQNRRLISTTYMRSGHPKALSGAFDYRLQQGKFYFEATVLAPGTYNIGWVRGDHSVRVS